MLATAPLLLCLGVPAEFALRLSSYFGPRGVIAPLASLCDSTAPLASHLLTFPQEGHPVQSRWLRKPRTTNRSTRLNGRLKKSLWIWFRVAHACSCYRIIGRLVFFGRARFLGDCRLNTDLSCLVFFPRRSPPAAASENDNCIGASLYSFAPILTSEIALPDLGDLPGFISVPGEQKFSVGIPGQRDEVETRWRRKLPDMTLMRGAPAALLYVSVCLTPRPSGLVGHPWSCSW